MLWNTCFKISVEAVDRAKFTTITPLNKNYVILKTPTHRTQ
ncbi:hypothetical protein B6N60_03907 [Richelia sinica FACHB-800]|uniref:Uncharacterized protein n=1 Tax=Richelia sinica FACHB-800 TaxID=1357546 RepID=A0A975TAM5_9NOST|nr:hypothetical protein B6N60_03907 [Richelia sinica FACHB-800]